MTMKSEVSWYNEKTNKEKVKLNNIKQLWVPTESVFDTFNISKRTNKFYSEFAKQTLEMDMERDKK